MDEAGANAMTRINAAARASPPSVSARESVFELFIFLRPVVSCLARYLGVRAFNEHRTTGIGSLQGWNGSALCLTAL